MNKALAIIDQMREEWLGVEGLRAESILWALDMLEERLLDD